jgi:GNAT superfamily N-acetyltransferase
VRKSAQRSGVGGKLMGALVPLARPRLLVGTWADAHWAIRFYEKHGFRLAPADEKNRLLDSYWTIPERQRDTSVVLVRA